MGRYSTRSKTITKLGSTNPTLFEYPDTGKEGLEPGKSVITFTRHDQMQLQTPMFFNDTIITFFMQYYLDTRISPEISQKTHIFNSFFFQKLKNIKEKKHNHTTYFWASKWLNGVRIFDKDFLIMPICEKEHWILIIVCYAYNEPSARHDMIADEDLYEPAVLVLNSCHGLAPAIKRSLRKFLEYQWKKERETERSFMIQNAKPQGIRLVFPELPQQKNNYDCGVYILNYFYCFLRDPRKAYVKMFRRHSMMSWFKDNKVDTSWERRKMTNIVRERISSWRESHKTDSANNNNHQNNNNNHFELKRLQYSFSQQSGGQEEVEKEENDDNSCQLVDLVEENDSVNKKILVIQI